jgi:hypothetical protein
MRWQLQKVQYSNQGFREQAYRKRGMKIDNAIPSTGPLRRTLGGALGIEHYALFLAKLSEYEACEKKSSGTRQCC